MAAAARKKPVTAKQRAADKANLVKARAAQKASGALHHHTAKQKAASQRNLTRARAAQKARRSGKKYVPAKAAKAPLALERDALMPSQWAVHREPACAAVAVAASLAAWGGQVSEDDVWALYARTGPLLLSGMLEAVAETGLAGWRLASYERADESLYLPGAVCGITLDGGYHAVLAEAGGMRSWGMVLPLRGTPGEAWLLEWEGPGDG